MSAIARRRLVDALPWVLLALFVGVDTARSSIIVSGSYPIAAVVASTMNSVRRTGYVAVASVALAGLSALWNDYSGIGDFGLRFALSAVLGAVAVFSASVRVGREQALANMTVIAETVQRAVLRGIPDRVGELRFAAQYQSATRAALVGGDLFEVADTAHGVRVIVGDVRGKGMEAVQLAATVLSAFRRMAFSEEELTGLADEIDKVVTAVAGDEDFVTAVLCEFGRGGLVTLVNRGHHPPLMVPPTRADPRFLDTGEPQPPLGMGGRSRSVDVVWPRHARLLMYTDGLVEARNPRGAFFPLTEWTPSLATLDLDLALRRLLSGVQEFTGHEATDDIALLLTENLDVAAPEERVGSAGSGFFPPGQATPFTAADD